MALVAHSDRVLAVFRKYDAAGAGTVPRPRLLRILSALAGLSEAEADSALATVGFPASADDSKGDVSYEAFIRSVFRPPSDLDDPDVVFGCCEVGVPGRLGLHELRFGLSAFGLFLEPADVQLCLAGRSGVDREGFKGLLRELLASAPLAVRRPRAVPYARRGVTLGQLQDLHSTFVESCWIHERIDDFNREHRELIEAGQVHSLGPNLYALDRFVIRPATTPGSGEEGLSENLRRAAKLPEATHHCSYSELVNPDGVQVDYFVSHWWGHPFADTMTALHRWAQHSLPASGKPVPQGVAFWLCFLAINQHRLNEEIGASPEQGPFNAALVQARGAIMVLDERVHPFSRIWCLYEVSRLTALGKDFEIVCSQGPVADLLKGGGVGEDGEAGEPTRRARETVERIEQALEKVSAFGAQASSDDDKFAIWHRVADPLYRRKPLKHIRRANLFAKFGDNCFKRFDAKIRGLLATPLLHASLSANDGNAVLRAIGLGATFTQRNFDDLRRLRGDICTLEVPVKRGKNVVSWKLLHCAAFFGHAEAVRCLLEARAEVSAATRFGWTALHLAASNGQAEAAELLLQGRAEIEAQDGTGRSALHAAAVSGHAGAAELLLRRGAGAARGDKMGETCLHAAAMGGHAEVVELLLEGRADVEATSRKGGASRGKTPLHYAAEDNFADVLRAVLRHAEAMGLRENLLAAVTKKGQTALDLALHAGHEESAELLR